jgi:hypothetical protein
MRWHHKARKTFNGEPSEEALGSTIQEGRRPETRTGSRNENETTEADRAKQLESFHRHVIPSSTALERLKREGGSKKGRKKPLELISIRSLSGVCPSSHPSPKRQPPSTKPSRCLILVQSRQSRTSGVRALARADAVFTLYCSAAFIATGSTRSVLW